MKPTVYIETTIVSYLTARPSRDILRLSHEMVTREWWTNRRRQFELFTSDFVVNEAERGDPGAAAERIKALSDIPLLKVSEEATDLTELLVRAMALPKRAKTDASHVAMAAIYGISYLLTWNCTHLANGTLADKIDETCLEAGYKAPRILTPELLMEVL